MAEDTAANNAAEEQPVREQLKKTSLESENKVLESTHVADTGGIKEDGTAVEEVEEFAKTGHDEQVASERAPARQHTRKRSRDSTAEEELLNNGQRKVSGERPRESLDESRAALESNGSGELRELTPDTHEQHSDTAEVASPKTKRTRVHSNITENGTSLENTSTNLEAKQSTSGSGKVPAGSGFANTSATSPFGTMAGTKSPGPSQTSSSAFASSGFSALSGASSAFGANASAPLSGFGSGSSFASGQPKKENEKVNEPSTGGFGGALGQMTAFGAATTSTGGFGTAPSGFGKLGGSTAGFGKASSGFGSLGAATGGGLTSFASGKPSTSFASSTKTAKPFGATKDDAEDDEDNDDAEDDEPTGHKSPLTQESEDKQDERFYKQDLETGEEGEDTVYSCRAKLYNFSNNAEGKKEWRERGLGTLRLNVSRVDTSETPHARFLMRAEGSHRVVLNTPIRKNLQFGDPKGGPPEGSFMYFMGTIGDSSGLELLQVKTKAQNATELYERIKTLQERM